MLSLKDPHHLNVNTAKNMSRYKLQVGHKDELNRNILWRLWGSSLPGPLTLNPLLGPPLKPVEICFVVFSDRQTDLDIEAPSRSLQTIFRSKILLDMICFNIFDFFLLFCYCHTKISLSGRIDPTFWCALMLI